MRKPLQCAGERADLQSERPARRDRDGRIELREVTIAHDFGNDVEIGSGIKAEDRVVVNPPDGIAGGDEVRIAGERGKPGEPETAEAK